ncbi:S-adenosylmethionine decarboxylase [Iningainema sp. BLCCT55]|uniref:S-adenosylmethionine decarboxylase n=1 Tax=Iningainema tapete BLCC-T55 TaxID=2748662 RepID=A0A8J6XD69_9CYAN|nr:S-adenosylmethionine decarboxylase [Iningainema tapete BLCC-T55]
MIITHHFSAILTASVAIFEWTEVDFITFLKTAAKSAELTPVSAVSFSFVPQGISAVLLLKESHVALHFWPEEEKVTIDIHVCDYQQSNQEKAKLLAKILALQLSGDDSIERWNYLCITG